MATPKRQTRKKEKSRTPVYFLSLTVENVRCFAERQTLDLSDGNGRPAQWTIILGDNGVGKTTLLRSLAAMIPTLQVEPDEQEDLVWELVPRYSQDYKLSSVWSPHRNLYGRCHISASLFIGTELMKSRIDTRISNFDLEWDKARDETYGFINSIENENMICVGYGASRQIGEAALTDKEDKDFTASLFSESARLLNVEEWLLQADYAASKPSTFQNRAIKQLDYIKEVLINLLPDVEDIQFVSEFNRRPRVQVKTPYGWVAIKDLSLGYRTLIAWMADFSSHMFDKYVDSKNPLAEPAVVLVDEIDLHLHPRWQRKLMSYLSERFPNTQFIVTAHSPLVVQAATDANIVLLRREGDHVVIDKKPQNIKGWRVDQILTSELFGLESARPPAYDVVVAEREKILSKTKLTKKDKERLHELAAKISEFPTGETPLEIEAMDIVRRAAQRLKKENHLTNDSHQ
jgi:predicted ATP-binding protein involved in virulence